MTIGAGQDNGDEKQQSVWREDWLGVWEGRIIHKGDWAGLARDLGGKISSMG